MPMRASSWLYLVICVAGAPAIGCNVVLGINEPEEILSPPVHYYPWDGKTGDGAPSDVSDASSEPPTIDAHFDQSRGEPDIATPPLPRPDAGAPMGDVRSDGPSCLHVADASVRCGFGCSVLCPLRNACVQNGDCSSGLCYAALCTLPNCLNGVLDGDETDLNCGGSCARC